VGLLKKGYHGSKAPPFVWKIEIKKMQGTSVNTSQMNVLYNNSERIGKKKRVEANRAFIMGVQLECGRPMWGKTSRPH